LGFLGLLVTIADPSSLGSTSSHPLYITVSASLSPPPDPEQSQTKVLAKLLACSQQGTELGWLMIQKKKVF
jgi:hypothetical protein